MLKSLEKATSSNPVAAGVHVIVIFEKLGTEGKIYYRSKEPWVRQMSDHKLVQIRKEPARA